MRLCYLQSKGTRMFICISHDFVGAIIGFIYLP